ncbi:MAG: cell division protein ZapA [Candidatus Zixiibacteriota bacterium]
MADSSTSNKVVVNIFGEDYPITGVTDATYISRIAGYVDAKMKEAAQSSRVVARDKVAILAAMSIASELHDAKETGQLSGERVESRLDGLLSRLDKVLSELS